MNWSEAAARNPELASAGGITWWSRLRERLEAGLVAAGVDSRLLGPMPTPAIAYLTQTLNAQAGIVILCLDYYIIGLGNVHKVQKIKHLWDFMQVNLVKLTIHVDMCKVHKRTI